ncbi:MAG: hypothetical protein R2719_08805 [Micropruina sp.]
MTAEILTRTGRRPVLRDRLAPGQHRPQLRIGDRRGVRGRGRRSPTGPSCNTRPRWWRSPTPRADHLDNWGTTEAYFDGFVRLCGVPASATVVLSTTRRTRAASPGVRQRRQVVTFGEDGADVRLTGLNADGPEAFATLHAAGDTGELRLAVPGRISTWRTRPPPTPSGWR